MAKKLYRFPNAKTSIYATEKTMANVCIAIEQEILAKYNGEYVIGFDLIPSRIDGFQLHGEQLCYDVLAHIRKV